MEKKNTLLILITIFLLATSAGAADRPAVDFGTYTAPQEISKTVAVLVPLADEGWSTWKCGWKVYPQQKIGCSPWKDSG